MDARMVTLTPKPGHLDSLAEFWDDVVVSQIADQPGNRGFVLLKDTANGRLVGLSLWESAADADAAGSTFRAHMSGVADHLASPPTAVVAQVAAASASVLSH
jgi:heme-degrading monooxygenase HmoA